MRGATTTNPPLAIWAFVTLTAVKVGLALAQGTGFNVLLGVLVVSLTLLMMSGAEWARWLLIVIVVLGIYTVWALEEPTGPSMTDMVVVCLGCGQILALMWPSARTFTRDRRS